MMSGTTLGRAAGPLAGLRDLPGHWTLFEGSGRKAAPASSQSSSRADEDRASVDRQRRLERVRYHLGRGRRAREAGRFEAGVAEARRALVLNPQEPWALSLLGQCLSRQHEPDLRGARLALERAQALDPTNGYFVRLLLDVLNAHGDIQARADTLAWAWWKGAPVERWLPDGPPLKRASSDQADTSDAATGVPGTALAFGGVSRPDGRVSERAPSMASR